MTASTTLSSSSCRTMRQRVAPSAVRMPISRARAADRDSRRLATLAQAMSRMKPTAPIMAQNIVFAAPPTWRLGERLDPHGRHVLVVLGIGGDEPLCDAVHLGARFLARHPGRSTPKTSRSSCVTLLARVVGNLRQPDLRVVRKQHLFGHDPDDGGWLAVDANGRADDVRIAAVAVLPEGVADDGDGLGALLLVGGREIAAEEGRLTDQAEDICGDPGTSCLLGQSLRVADVHHAVAGAAKPLEGPARLAPVAQLRVRHQQPPLPVTLPGQHEHAVGVVVGQAAQESGIHDAEADGVDADPERQGGYRSSREPAFLEDEAKGEAKILEHGG